MSLDNALDRAKSTAADVTDHAMEVAADVREQLVEQVLDQLEHIDETLHPKRHTARRAALVGFAVVGAGALVVAGVAAYQRIRRNSETTADERAAADGRTDEDVVIDVTNHAQKATL